MKFAFSITLVGVAALSACGGVNPVKTPNSFIYRMNDGVLQGSYNPSGFSTEQVKLYAKQYCSEAKLASYAESAPGGDGLVAFRATCRGEMPNGHAIILKREDGSVLLESTLSKDGELHFDQKAF
ncbi:hypothetical protein [Pseudodonghicola xiamenensis]|uniref:Lipoprotein n=1 Tax=Pseudodonghicola xiamenensis TaxID=337702 RepID=A0A8J3H9X3_9RHOB|nr:hypothetical protein [Pseudodonghicola xiamenensis]GHG98820.1 hypothetical protein GCM10010961_34320 [Pseudodonghicola xiamenensis]